MAAFTSLCSLVICVALVSCAINPPAPLKQAQRAPSDRFQTSEGAIVDIPANGAPNFNPDAGRIAGNLKALDAAVVNWKLPQADIPSDLAAAVVSIVKESRDNVIVTMADAYEIAQRTAGPLDSRRMNSAQINLKTLQDAVSAAPGSLKWYAVTDITSEAGAAIHYVAGVDFDKASTIQPAWQSYTQGQSMRIGRYIFRVQPNSPARPPFFESVPILVDPFARNIVRVGL
jgi:hypothetical protein